MGQTPSLFFRRNIPSQFEHIYIYAYTKVINYWRWFDLARWHRRRLFKEKSIKTESCRIKPFLKPLPNLLFLIIHIVEAHNIFGIAILEIPNIL